MRRLSGTTFRSAKPYDFERVSPRPQLGTPAPVCAFSSRVARHGVELSPDGGRSARAKLTGESDEKADDYDTSAVVGGYGLAGIRQLVFAPRSRHHAECRLGAQPD